MHALMFKDGSDCVKTLNKGVNLIKVQFVSPELAVNYRLCFFVELAIYLFTYLLLPPIP